MAATLAKLFAYSTEAIDVGTLEDFDKDANKEGFAAGGNGVKDDGV